MVISFVIPVFRNEGSLKITFDSINQLMAKMNYDFEIIFVNDGSDDNSLNELKEIYDLNDNVSILSLSRNFGQLSAILAGYNVVNGDLIITMSADLQDPVTLIEEMINKASEGNEIVIAHRIEREDNFIARITSRLFYSLIKISIPKMPRGGFDFILMNRNVLKILNSLDERNRFLQGDILWLGFNVIFIPYKRLKRVVGKSQWTFNKKLKYFIDGFITTSFLPIRFISFIGFLFSLLGLIYSIAIIYSRLVNNTPFKGWAPIMVILLIASGLIMLMLGIIGEYLWRTFDEVRKRPIYIVKDKMVSKNKFSS